MLLAARNVFLTKGTTNSTLALLWNESGSGAYATSNYSARGITNISFGGWVYYFGTADKNGPSIGWASTGSWGGFSIGVWQNNFYFRGGSSSAVVRQIVPSSDIWYHLFIVKSGTQFRCFINGEVIASTTCPATFSTNVGTRFKIVGGTYSDSDTQTYFPQISLAGIAAFSRSLTDAEVKYIFDKKLVVDTTATPFNNDLWFAYNCTSEIENNTIRNETGDIPLTVYNPSLVSLKISFPDGTPIT